MDLVVSNVGCSILASIIYDIGKVCFDKFYVKLDKDSLKEIEKCVQDNFSTKYEMLYMSGQFNDFIQAPFFKDTIENYIIYKISGNYSGNLRKLKKNNKMIVEKDVIEFLTSHLLDDYYYVTVNVPSKTMIRHFFEDFFKVAANYFASNIKDKDGIAVYMLNSRMDVIYESIMLRLNDIIDNINRVMKCDIVPIEDKYSEYVKQYHKILKTNHSKAHIYLLDQFEFEKFYVPPILRCTSTEQEISNHVHFVRRDYYRYRVSYYHDKERKVGEESYDDWRYIFDNSGIVYVTGGPGYGKSLFLKKIINDFEKINIFNSTEYLVIYGDLKAFYSEGDKPLSMVTFLQDSMVKETLMDRKFFPIEMIEYYLKLGRCLILFDALDEVEKQKREDLHKRIIAYFKNQNPNNKICITSRSRGFIPEKDVEVFDILPLNREQIESYVDNIIKLGKFDEKDKKIFLEQAEVLVNKGFLNSFLILSLLINIYKAERELPENKMELYQKCFEYIAYKREKEKTKAKFDWNLISYMMKENTFMELARMCFPNNCDIGKKEIVEMLCDTYKGKYTSMVETERAAENFLFFCSDRTELFVPAAGEDRFKFFHRSFFEFFYAQYIFVRVSNVEKVYELLKKFDVDSEVFELTLAMMKQKDEMRYQELVEYLFDEADKEAYISRTKFVAFNILTLGMQVIDDNIYIQRYIDYILKNSEQIVRNIKYISSDYIIYSLINENKEYVDKVNKIYNPYSTAHVIISFLNMYQEFDTYLGQRKYQEIKEEPGIEFFSGRFYVRTLENFYVQLFLENTDYSSILDKISEEKFENLMIQCKLTKRRREKYQRLLSEYLLLDKERQSNLQKIMLTNPRIVKII